MLKQKKWQTKGGLVREDSDDELGYEDHPWRWVYEEKQESSTLENAKQIPRKRKAEALEPSNSRTIIGARMGSFMVKVGDSILLKSPEQGKDWVGLICGFSKADEDGEDEMCVYIQWFCAPEELSFGKRTTSKPEILPNETYITADFNLNPLTAINGKAIVLSKDAFFKTYLGGKPPKSKSAAIKYSKTVLCRKAVKQRNMLFSEEFVWEDKYQGPENLLNLIDWIKDQTKGRRSKVKPDEDYQGSPKAVDSQQDNKTPATPRKKQKISSTTTTPRSTAKSTRFITPTNKKIMVRKPLEITPLGTRLLSPSLHLASPYSHARTTLHVSAVPHSLPCRSDEFATVYTHLHAAITDGSGACIYISGTPGTGKTATVREVIATLQEAVSGEELDDFISVEINGMKVTEPQQSYSLLWEALKGDRVSPHHALSLLEHEFSHPSPRRIPCVVLMDELDQLVTKNQSVMYNFFNWPALRHSRLIVLAVANTMDLPERTLSNKISSRLGLTRITFPGYTHTQLMEIITSRLEGVPGNIVDPDAVQFASRKVAAVSGDARRALDICRRAVEIAEQAQEKIDFENSDEPTANTPSRRGRTPNSRVNGTSNKKLARVTIATIKQAINEATSSPVAQHLRSLPLASKLLLAAIIARLHRTGITETSFGEVMIEAKRIADSSELEAIRDFMLVDQKAAMPRLAVMGGAVMELFEAGFITAEMRRSGERVSKIRLRISEEDVKVAFSGDMEMKGLISLS